MRRVSSPVFVGRAEELAALDAALARAARAEPAVVMVAGESGVGKSRLVSEFAARARASGGRVLTGECIELVEGELPYAPIVRMLRSLDPDELSELAGTGRAELSPLIPEAIEAAAPRPDEQFAQGRMFDLLLTVFGRLGDTGPLVLVIEDLHWGDRSTRDFLAFLARALRSQRLVLVATYRSDELHRKHPLRPLLAEFERLGRAERVELPRFSRPELAAQLTGILEEAPEGELTDALFARSEGNPFFAEELLAAGGSDGTLPETLRDALMVRVEALGEPSQELLRLAAAAGRSVTHRLLSEVAERDELELLSALREAVANHLLVQEESGETYAFRHALMREAICDDLLPGERSAIHLKLARALSEDPSLSTEAMGPAAELSYHWQQAHDLPRALTASMEAGAQAERMRAPAEAAHQFENALGLWDQVEDPEALTGTTLVELLRRAAERAHLAGAPARALALARRALELTDPADRVAAALQHERLGRYLWVSGRDGDALTEYLEAVHLMPPEPPSAERALVLASLSQSLMLLGDMERLRDLAPEAIDLARRTGARAVEAHAMTTLGTCLAGLGMRDEGIATMRRALEIEKELGSPDDLQRTYTNLSDALDAAGEVEEASRLALEGLVAVRELGIGRGFSAALLAEAAGRQMRLGRLDEAERLITQAVDEAPMGVSEVLIRDEAGRLALLRGRLDEAELHLEKAREVLKPSVGSMALGPLYASLCDLAAARGDIGEVRRLMNAVQERIVETDAMGFFIAPLYLAAVRAEADAAERARDRGDAGGEREARESGGAHAARADGFRRGTGLEGTPGPRVLADVALVDAELTRLEGEPSPDAWTEPMERNENLGNVLAAAYAGMRQAEALLALGDREPAAEPLRAAHAVSLESGAPPLRDAIEALARRARIELTEAGAATGGPVSDAERLGLTPRETEVLALVAAGRTNRQIGEELFISEKTASVHVSRILAKLDVRGRGEAAAVAHRLGLTGERGAVA